MSVAFNPYEYFLGTKVDPVNPDFYALFGLDPALATAEAIHLAADRTIAKVRAQKPGDKAKQWAALIDELTKAKTRLIEESKTSLGEAVAPDSSVDDGVYRHSFTPDSQRKKNQAKVKRSGSKPTRGKTTNAEGPSSGRSTKADKPNREARPTPTTAESSSGSAGKKQTGSPNILPAKSTQGKGNDLSFTLEAPEQNDSFDSDTHLSTNAFDPSSVMAPTVDPMAPLADPTSGWSTFDISTLDEAGFTRGIPKTGTGPETGSGATVAGPAVSGKTSYSQSHRAKSKVGMIIGGTLLFLLIVGGISLALFNVLKGNGEKVADNDLESNVAGQANAESEKDASPGNKKNPSVSQKNANADPVVKKEPTQDSTKKSVPQEPAEKGETKDAKKTPGEPKGDPENPKKTEPPGDPPQKNPGDPPEKKKEEPKELPQPKISEIAELAKLMYDAKAKLFERNMVESNRLLEKAMELPALPDHKLKLARLAQVGMLYGKFWNKVVEGCGKLKALDEIKFSDSTIVKIVESSEEMLVYRGAGKTFRKEPRELHIGLAMKIAEKVMDPQGAEFRMVKGAVFAIDAENNPERAKEARTLWEEAKLLGSETEELVLFLDDTYELIAETVKQEKIPDEKAAEGAQTRFKEKYASEMRAANRTQKLAAEFANQLLGDVPSLDDPADRNANFEAAIFYAGKAGDVELAMKTIMAKSQWFLFETDVEVLRVLTNINKGRLKPEQKKEVMRSAFEAMDLAKKESKPELELKFAELALAAARGTREPNLVETATRELQRVKAFMQDPN